MKRYLPLALVALFIFACEKNPEEDKAQTKDYSVSGLVEKGPFVSGSTLNLQPLNEAFTPVGTNFHTDITDNDGSFNLGKISLDTPYATLSANGYFFNEVTGELSKGTLSLNAIVDLSNKSTVNVNLLTHLKYYRIQHLLSEGKSFKDADKQAQEELLTAFGLQAFNSGDVSQYSITAGTDQAAALIAISSLVLVNRTEAQLTEYLSNLSKEFGDNGVFSSGIKAKIAADMVALDSKLDLIKDNIVRRYQDLGKNVTVKELYSYFDWDGDGVADYASRPSFEVLSQRRTTSGRVMTFTTNRDWNVAGKPDWVTIEPSSGKASSQPQTISIKGSSPDLEAIGNRFTYSVSYGNDEKEIEFTYYPARNHSDKRLLLLYSAGFNSLSAYLKDDIESLCGGYVPSSDANDDVLLVFSRLSASGNDFSTPTKPVLFKVYENDEGEIIRETLKEWSESTVASSKETMQSVFSYISEHFPDYGYGMVFSSHGSGWLPAGYYANPQEFGDDYATSTSGFNVSTKSIGQDRGSDGSTTEMELKEFVEGLTVHLNYLVFDVVYMAGIEVVYELRNKCDYIAASATEILADGLNYDLLSYRILCSEQSDLKGVCEDYYSYYAKQSGQMQSATISLVDCSKLSYLESVCHRIFESNGPAFNIASENGIQSFNRMPQRPFFYDMADVFRAALGESSTDYSEVSAAILDCVIYRESTPAFMGKAISTFCGLSMFIPSLGRDYIKNYYNTNISWCKDTEYMDAQDPMHNPQYLIIQYGVNTKSSITIEDAMTSNPFVEGVEVSVNGETYALERLDVYGGAIGVKVPKAEQYIVSYPAGKIVSDGHVARVTTTIESNQTAEPEMYFYGALAPYGGIEVGNPSPVQMQPCLAAMRFTPAEGITDIEIGPAAENEYFVGTASFVPNENDKYLFSDLNPNIEFKSDACRFITVNNDCKTDSFYIVTFPQTLSQGLKVKYTVVQKDPSTGAIIASVVNEKTTTQLSQLRAGTIIAMTLPNH